MAGRRARREYEAEPGDPGLRRTLITPCRLRRIGSESTGSRWFPGRPRIRALILFPRSAPERVIALKVIRMPGVQSVIRSMPGEHRLRPPETMRSLRRLPTDASRSRAAPLITEGVDNSAHASSNAKRALERNTSAAAAAGEQRLAEQRRAQRNLDRRARDRKRFRELEQRVTSSRSTSPSWRRGPEPPPPQSRSMRPSPRAPSTRTPNTEATYTLALERLVRERSLRGDPHAEEWAYYLPLLLELRRPDSAAAQFASLVRPASSSLRGRTRAKTADRLAPAARGRRTRPSVRIVAAFEPTLEPRCAQTRS